MDVPSAGARTGTEIGQVIAGGGGGGGDGDGGGGLHPASPPLPSSA